MISINGLKLIIDEICVFKDISITLLPSAICYLIGDNGSGKTSLLRILSGIQKQSDGKISCGKNNNQNIQNSLYIGHNTAIKNELSVLENIMIWSKIYDSIEKVDAAIHYFNLYDVVNKKCYELSAGNKQKVALTRLLTCNADFWLLDEVDQNLDQKNQTLLDRLIITKANNRGIIIFATQNHPRIKSAHTINMQDYE